MKSATKGSRDIAAVLKYVNSSFIGAISLSKKEGIQRALGRRRRSTQRASSRG